MIQKIILTLLLFLSVSICFASGNRSIKPDSIVADRYSEESIKDLNRDASYLGTTGKWHLFAIIKTSYAGGHPFDNTIGYKIAVDKVKVINGWTLSAKDLLKLVNPDNCPRIAVFKPEQNLIVVNSNSHPKTKCLR